LIQLIAESEGKNSNFLYLNESIIIALARLRDFLNLPLNSDSLQKLTQSYVISNFKIKTALGKSLTVLISEGLKFTFNSFYINQ
jgi:hypothetical protein